MFGPNQGSIFDASLSLSLSLWRARALSFPLHKQQSESYSVYDETCEDTFTIDECDPLSATATSKHELRMQHEAEPAMSAHIKTASKMVGTAKEFVVENTLHIEHNGAVLYDHTWTDRIPRDLV